MATWYRTGTVSVTNGSTAVTGTGTAFVDAKVKVGELIILGDFLGEIASVVSNTSITLVEAYAGSNLTNVTYAVVPTRGLFAEWFNSAQTFNDLITAYQDGPLVGRFGDGTVSLPGMAFLSQINLGFRRRTANVLTAVVNGVDRAEFTTAGMTLTGLLSGTAVTQSATDTTAGRVLKVGDYGLGAAAGTVIYGRANLVGTVSQSGGAVTGAAMQEDSNSDGAYTRLASGLQICTSPAFTADATTASGSMWKWAANQTWTFPIAFSAAPVVGPGSTNNNSLVATAAAATATQVSVNVLNSVSATGRTTTFIAIGRWF